MTSPGCVRAMANPVLSVLQAGFFALVSSLLAPSQAHAQGQSIDWLVSIDDIGFDPVVAGGSIEYVVDVTNNGFDPAPATTVLVDVPANTLLTGTSGTLSGCTVGGLPVTFPTAGPETVTCNVPALGSQAVATSVFEIETLQVGVIAATARVPTSTSGVPVVTDALVGNNTSTEQTTVSAGADLIITLGAPLNIASGDFIDFDISVLNDGPNASSGFTIEFPIPTGVVNITGPAGGPLPSDCSIANDTVTCLISGTLANNATLLRSFQGQVSAAGGSTITSSASVLDTNPEDPDINNNTSVVDTSTDAGTDVEISIQQSGLPIVNVGDNSEFTIEAGYSGTSPQNLTITTEIPANYTLNAAGITTTAGWVCAVTPMTQEVTCTLPSGSITGVNVSLGQITIPTAVAVAGPTLVTAEITTGVGSPAETNFFNNTSQISATVTNRFIDLRANKVGPNPALAVVGNTYRYVLSTTNIGNVGFDGVLRMVDTLPQGMLVTSILDNGWSCTPSIPPSLAGPALLECELTYLPTAQLAPGDTTPQVRLGIEITESPPSGLLSNIMSVSSSNSNIVEDPSVLGNNTTTSIVETRDPNASADVGAVKTASRASLLAGEIQTFQIEVTNIGPGVASNIRVFDSLEGLINSDVGPTDAGVVSISEPAGFTCGTTIDSATVRELLCTTPSLAVCTPANGAVAGDCPIIEVSVRPGGAPGTRINTVSVRSLDTPDPDLSNRRSAVNYEVLPLTDVTVSKNATPTPAIAGQDVTFVITATNLDTLANGTITSLSDAENVTITDTLPDNVRFISATPSSGSCGTQPTSGAITNNSQVICNLGTLQSGAQRTVTIVLQPINILRGTTIINRVNVETTTAEIDDGLADADRNNSAEVSVPIENLEIDLLVNKEDSVDPVAVGDTTVYTLRVTNAGPSAAENVVVTDVLPDAIFAYRGHTISGAGVCGQVPVAQVTPHPSAALRTLECTFPYLAANASETVQITVEAVDQGTIPNTVSITSAEITAGFDREPENNTTTETTTARSRADVAVTSKVPSASNVSLREAFNFVITLENNPTSSGFEAAVVTLTDNLPTGMVLTGAPTAVITSGTSTLNSCTGVANDASFACQFGTISEDAVAQITVPVKVIAIASQNQLMENTAQVSTISFDNVVANNSSIGRVTVSGSSLAGTVYRDFNDSATAIANGIDEARDTGIVGVTMTVQGVAIDGQAINETTITNNDGEYSFAFLPAGTYSVTRGVVNEPSLITGQNTVGSTGGTITSGSQISSIALPATVAATGYDFAEVPQSSISSIALVKSADLSALSNPPQAGDIVTYNFRIRNTGNVTLNDVTLTDTVPGVMLSGSPIPTLLPGNENTTSYSATYALQPEDLDGQISNTAIVTGVAPDSSIVEDTSGTSLTNDTPTITGIPVTVFTPAPSISLNKTVDASDVLDGAEPGEMLTYGFVITNTGNVPLFDVTLSDNLAGLTLTGSPIAQLNVGESNSAAYTATYEITVNDLDAGRVVNTAIVEGAEVRGGAPVATDTDTETVPLEVIDQQTEEVIEAIPEVFPPFEDGGSTTSVLASDLLNSNPATFDTVTITVIREDDGVTLDPTTGILTLAPGFPAGVYKADYQICSIATPGLCDTTTETVVQGAKPSIEATKPQTLIDNGDGVQGAGDTLVYEITVENTGNIALGGVKLTDTMTDFAGRPLTLDSGPDFVSADAGSPEGSLEIGETATYTARFVVTDQVMEARGVNNTVTARAIPAQIQGVSGIPSEVTDVSDNGIDTDGNTEDDVTKHGFTPITTAVEGNVSLAKTTTSDVVRRGDTVPYTITLMNETSFMAGPLTLIDTLPAGIIFTPDSASIAPTEVQAGQITWTGLTVPPSTRLEITLSGRVLSSAAPGDHVNRANLVNPSTGAPMTPEATATVRLLPEAVFECGEVIGKVFTDLNADGYQNGPGLQPRKQRLTDQDYAGGKGAPAPKTGTEKGIPNVRLVTVDGSIITTDENGLYSVPCAMLPQSAGSNFILKLDTRSLPSGYRLTTENPRVMRLTPGMMTEMNFGATIGKVVRVDLDGNAFTVTGDGNVALSNPLKKGIAQLLPQIANESVNLRITFHVSKTSDSGDLRNARKMMQAVDKHIKREWRKVGRTRLLVEQTIARAGE